VCRKICQDVGLNVQQVATGSAIEAMTDEELTQLVKVCSVFVKMTPQQKLRIIRLLQHQGNTVGYLGDGINDGPSLKAADVSISVDNAIDIAKESADIILLEKNLMILKNGVLEGRKVFGNLMKYLKITSSSNFGNVISLMGASVLLPFLPMAPVQILVNDLLYDLSQSAVPTDQVDDEYLKSPKTWDIKSITNYMYFIGPISSVFDYLLFGYLWFFLDLKTVASSNIFQTGWFTESLLSQIFIVYVLRTSKIPFFESRPSTSLLLTTLTIAIVAIALPFMPFTESLNLAILPTDYWYGLLIFLGGYVLLMQLIKSQLVKRFGWI
jgi:Mg2+-importing ATPase